MTKKNVHARTQADIDAYREKIFKSKEECRKKFAAQPFHEKLKTAKELYKFGLEFKKAKRVERKKQNAS